MGRDKSHRRLIGRPRCLAIQGKGKGKGAPSQPRQDPSFSSDRSCSWHALHAGAPICGVGTFLGGGRAHLAVVVLASSLHCAGERRTEHDHQQAGQLRAEEHGQLRKRPPSPSQQPQLARLHSPRPAGASALSGRLPCTYGTPLSPIVMRGGNSTVGSKGNVGTCRRRN